MGYHSQSCFVKLIFLRQTIMKTGEVEYQGLGMSAESWVPNTIIPQH